MMIQGVDMKLKMLKSLLLVILFTQFAHSQFKIGTFNIRNYDRDDRSNQRTNKALLAQIIFNQGYDLFAVQEIHEKKDFTGFLKYYFPHYGLILSQCGGAHQQYLGFVYDQRRFQLIRFYEDMSMSVTSDNQQPQCNDGSRPGFVAQFFDKQTQKTFIAISLHLKSGGNSESIRKRYYQLNSLSKIIRKLGSQYGPVMIMGDLNTTEYIKGENDYYHRLFDKFASDHRLTNLTRDVGCTNYWWGNRDDGFEYPSHLDHVLVDSNFFNTYGNNYKSETSTHCARLNCRPATLNHLGKSFQEVSDHCPLKIEF